MEDHLFDIYKTTTAAEMIVRVFFIKMLYPKDIDANELIKIMNKASTTIKNTLTNETWKDFKDRYEHPIYENDLPPKIISEIFVTGVNQLKEKNQDLAFLEGYESRFPHEFKQLYIRLDEIRAFECKFPDDGKNKIYKSPKRFFFLLRKYWREYFDILQFFGTAPLGYSPNPLAQIITNLEYRIRYCVEQINHPSLNSIYSNLALDPIGSEDLSMDWECGGHQMCKEFERAINEVLVEFGSAEYELMPEEDLFLNECAKALGYVKEKTKKDWIKTSRQMDEKAKHLRDLWQHSGSKDPITTKDYIEKVENALRKIVKKVYQEQFGTKWLNVVKDVMGDVKHSEAKKRMEARKEIDAENLLFFTDPSDLHVLIKEKWELCKGFFNVRLKDFNKLIAVFLKGRTEDAHNRPEHLWPRIERERTRVACYDLLKTIKRS